MNAGGYNNPVFNQALLDYYYLLNRGYPEKGSLKLTGDRYKLSTEYRNILYRGVTSHKNAQKRSDKLGIPASPLLIDGYNVLLTLLNYRQGRFVFISLDHICRDAGSLYGRRTNQKLLGECISLLASCLRDFQTSDIIIYLDSPVTSSEVHGNMLQKALKHNRIKGMVEVVKSADKTLESYIKGTIATSDSKVLDNTLLQVFDLSRYILESRFKAELFDLGKHLLSITGK